MSLVERRIYLIFQKERDIPNCSGPAICYVYKYVDGVCKHYLYTQLVRQLISIDYTGTELDTGIELYPSLAATVLLDLSNNNVIWEYDIIDLHEGHVGLVTVSSDVAADIVKLHIKF